MTKTVLEQMFEITNPVEFLDAAVKYGMPQDKADIVLMCIGRLYRVQKAGGGELHVSVSSATFGPGFQQALMLTLSLSDDENLVWGFAFAFSEDRQRIVTVKPYARQEMAALKIQSTALN
jgi:hypothetical protein